MLTYLLIGLGGAAGSIVRAWLGAAVAALSGPAFPWGTILINIIGSFVIGFFGTLTATDGRFAVASDWRAFVMIGLCGGFTTFSSFSLQTLELIRDDRAAQALGNIALSVGLCLAAVAAGASMGLVTRTSRLAAAGAPPGGTLGGSMVVVLHGPERVDDMLGAAARLLALGEGRKVTALAAHDRIMAPLLPSEEVMTRERKAAIAARHDEWSLGMRQALDRWVREEARQGFAARWIEVGADVARALTEHGRDAHLLLLEQHPGDPGAAARVHAALLGAGRPVLLVPPGGLDFGVDFDGTVVVAWADNRHVRLALKTAAPLLAKARRVVVLRVDAASDQGIPVELRHLPVELMTTPRGDGTVGARLLAVARDAGASLLVMGGDSHGAFRERMLGGVTQGVLEAADLPVLLQHQG